MTDDTTTSPFARLDTSLMRSTKSLQEPERPKTRTPEEIHAPTPQRANTPTDATQNERRAIKRGSFEFYVDQLEQLQRLSLEEKMHGKKGSQSEMVREALEAYFERRGVKK